MIFYSIFGAQALFMSNADPDHYQYNSSVQDAVVLFRRIRKRWWAFLILIAIFFLPISYFYHRHTYYIGRVTFLVNSSNLAEILWDKSKENVIEFNDDDKGNNRIGQIVYSNQMFDHLIEQFNLYEHYRIPKQAPQGYLWVSSTLRKNITLQVTKYKIISIEVNDPYDYNVAANLANAIGKKINEINRKITLEFMSRKTELFEDLSKDLKKSTQQEVHSIDSALASLQAIFNAGNVRDPYFVSYINNSIDNLKMYSQNYYDDLFDSYKLKLYALYSYQDKNLPGITILERALPNEKSKSRYDNYMYPLIFLLSVLIAIFLFYMYQKVSVVMSYVWRHSHHHPGMKAG